MSKELEALKIGIPKLKKLYENNVKKMNKNDILGFDLTFVYLDKALQELQAIKSAEPSEAIDCFKRVWNDINEYNNFRQDFEDLKIVENYILKAQEQEKALKIIFEKHVDIDLLGSIIRDYEEEDCCMIYNEKVCCEEELTQEEFNLIKERFKYE